MGVKPHGSAWTGGGVDALGTEDRMATVSELPAGRLLSGPALPGLLGCFE